MGERAWTHPLLTAASPPTASKASVSAPAYKLTGETGSYRFMAPEVFRHEQVREGGGRGGEALVKRASGLHLLR